MKDAGMHSVANALAARNHYLVGRVLQGFRLGKRDDVDELEGEGMMALVEASRAFDDCHPSGASFETYATSCIRAAMMTSLGRRRRRLAICGTDGVAGIARAKEAGRPDAVVERRELVRFVLGSCTRREQDVLRSLAQGLSADEIGVRLDISAGTVRSHLAKARRRMGTVLP